MMATRIALPVSLLALLLILGGCTTDRDRQIPPTATPVSAGNDRVVYTATAAGTVWVWDSASDRILYSGPLAMNQSIAVDTQANQITVDGRVVFDKGLHSDNYKIYFLASSQAPVVQ
jgi:hypothetical protein